jgi:RHS repeat-associated protein
MLMQGRSVNSPVYRYGFNGKENDDESKGQGNQIDYGARVYDPRIGRFLSVDPMQEDYSWNSPYAFAENDIIRSIDLDGLEKYILSSDRYVNPSTKQPETSRHLYLNPNESQHNRGLIGHYGPDNKMTIINDPNLLSEFDKKVYDYALSIMSQKNISGGSIRMPTNVDIKLKVGEKQKVVNSVKPKEKIQDKIVDEESSTSRDVYMKPNGNGILDRNAYAVNNLFKPTIENLIHTVNSKSKDISQIDISITLTTNSSNENKIEDIRNKILSLYPKAKLTINYDPKYKSTKTPGKISSDEDFGYEIKVKGYKKN